VPGCGPRGRACWPSLDALRAIDVSSTEEYGIWALDGTGPVANWAQALLAISQETAGARLAGRSGRLPGSAPTRSRLRPTSGTGRGPAGGAARHPQSQLNRNMLVQGSRITAVIDWEPRCTVIGCMTRQGDFKVACLG
jgi:hypothetical protein